MKIRHARYVVLLFCLTALMIYFYGRINYTPAPYCYWDLKPYRAIAAAAPRIDPEVARPYAYRLLGPYLVGMLPFPETQSFCIVDTALAFSLPLFLYGFLCRRGITPPLSVFVVFLYLCNKYEFGLLSWDYFRVNDLISLILIILLLESLFHSRWLPFALFLLAGAMTREVIMLFIPVAFVYLFENKILRKNSLSFIVACLPGVLVFLTMRLAWSPPGKDLDEVFLTHVRKFASLETWGKLFLNAYAPISLVPLIFFQKTCAFFKDKKYMIIFIIFVFLTTAFGTDNERLFAPIFVVVYWLMATILQELNLRFSDRSSLLLILFTLLSSLHYEMTRFPGITRTGSIVITLIALLGFSLILLLKKNAFSSRPVSLQK